MKAIVWIAVFVSILMNTAMAQEKGEINLADSTGLPGDNFSLHGALGLFKESKTVEDFEKKLNTKDNSVNNLDLDGNGKTDYIRVVDMEKDNAHALVLQVAVTKTEKQDVAVIEIEQNGDASAMLQIVGDKQLYGENKIVEPKSSSEPEDKGTGKRGPSAYSHGSPYIFVNVWAWPCVRFIYAPAYVVWVSPWYWGYYPPWWSPWAPYPWRYHYMSCYHYHHHYDYTPYHHTTYVHEFYAPRRNASSQVTERYRENHIRYQATNAARRHSGNVYKGKTTQAAPAGRPGVKPGSLQPDPKTTRPVTPKTEQSEGRPSAPVKQKPSKETTVRPDRPAQQPAVKQPVIKQPTVKPSPKPSQPTIKSKPAPGRNH
jgi:hypothetical protein